MNNERCLYSADSFVIEKQQQQQKRGDCGQRYANAASMFPGRMTTMFSCCLWTGHVYIFFVFFLTCELDRGSSPTCLPSQHPSKSTWGLSERAKVIKSIYGMYSDTFMLLCLTYPLLLHLSLPLYPHHPVIHTLSLWEHIYHLLNMVLVWPCSSGLWLICTLAPFA